MSVDSGDDSAKNMTDLVFEIAKALVDSPDEVSVDAVPEGDTTVLRLRVAATDIGKVIGKQGRTARSLRTILAAASMKQKHRYALDIIEIDAPNG
ncbi:KH domain-containing protein [Edaphobacter flagellatus]|uniref:KH domain-containing protein n=1 Tax=Edaphobacter flagellatus TaxID=1933044 RepID=UPI0021B1BE73|nr:KH domain-containing protein [Edaphobacter flagellatus]